jgi:type VI secretion system secreted protein VgrG
MSHTTFELRVHGIARAIPVAAFDAIERINALDRVDLRCSERLLSAEESLLGQAATLSLTGTAEGPRAFHGIVTREADSQHGGSKLRLEPRMSALRHAASWRIFHALDVLAVATKILREHGVSFRTRLGESYVPRPHWTQRGESDLEFLFRIFSEEGIFFFFDHPQVTSADPDETNIGSAETLVLCDTAQGYSPILGERAFQVIGTMDALRPGEGRALVEATLERKVRPSRALVRRHDFVRPMVPVLGETSEKLASQLATSRRGVWYEHEHDDANASPAPRFARARLDALRRDAARLRATTSFPHALPGRVIAVDGGGAAAEHVVVAARHQGRAAERSAELTYQVALTLAPAAVPIRLTPRPVRRVLGLETATVTGPPGKEIHTDEHGRVQVRFHWDVEAGTPEAWLRVSQPWAGAGYGAGWLPRVGSEVLIGYVDGHPDRPVVVGSLHHAASPAPIHYPHDGQAVGIRTRSTPGGAGSHELIFDDRAGAERVSLRSARSLFVEAIADAATRIGGNEEHATGGSWTQDVGVDLVSRVGGSRTDAVASSYRQAIGGDRAVETAGDERRRVAGIAHHSYAAGKIADVGGDRHTFVGSGDGGGSDVLSASRDITLSAGRALELRAKERVVIRCGESSITLTPERISLESKHVELYARERSEVQHGPSRAVALAYDGAFELAAETITLASADGASLVLDADAKLDGALVKLNCGGASAGGTAPPGVVGESGEAVFRLDTAGVAPGTPFTFVIAAPDGERLEREIVPGGEIRLQGRPGERFGLVEVLRNGVRVATQKRGGEEG